MKKIFSFTLFTLMLFTTLGMTDYIFADTEEVIGSYNVYGLENYDYELDLSLSTSSSKLILDNEKLSFYMVGGDLVSQGEDFYRFVAHNASVGIKFIFIAPEAGRHDGEVRTSDFYDDVNSSLVVKDVDYILYRFVDEEWIVELGDQIIDPTILYTEGESGLQEELKTAQTDALVAQGRYILNLENYTLSREHGEFEFFHAFNPGSVIESVMDDPGITFKAKEIMFRTFESRLSSSSTKGVIYTDRTPSDAIIGQIIRFTGDSDDGDNVARIQSVDKENNKVYIKRINDVSYNTHQKGTWLRAYNDYSNGMVVKNEYPKISLSPSFWTISEAEISSLFNTISEADPTGLLKEIDIELDQNDAFGYVLKDVTYNSDGLNFVGSMNGAFYVGFDFYFFGRTVHMDPIRVDYGDIGTGLSDQILRVNTYKREAFRFNFDPGVFGGYAQFSDMGSFNPPDTFPLRFRIYLDKDLSVVGGNVRVRLPGKGIPLPGGLIYIDNIGGGYREPSTYEVSAQFTSYEVLGFPLWQAEAEMELALDQRYLTIDGSSWIFGKKIQLGDFDATVAWSYYTGKRFKGVEVSAEVGVAKGDVELIMDFTFKVKRYKSSGVTKTYVGGSGSARVEAFGYTFSGVSVKANTKRFKASVKVPVLGHKSVYVKYSSVSKNLYPSYYNGDQLNVSMLPPLSDYGVANFYDDVGNEIVLIPEAQRLSSNNNPQRLVNTVNFSSTISEGAIVIDYDGELDSVSVTLPDGTTKQVIIATEETVYDPQYLYAMDYDVSDTERQLYIQLENPQIGDYDVDTGDTNVLSINTYEITQLPYIEEDSFTASLNGDVVTLDWDLEEDISGTTYHLSLQQLKDGVVVNEIPLYEDYVNELEEDIELYVPDSAVTSTLTANSLRLLMPDYLEDGDYRFVIEPVKTIEEEIYSGEVQYSNTITIDNPDGVAMVTNLDSNYIGNGLTEFTFDHVLDATGYELVFKDSNGMAIETFSVSVDDLIESGHISGNVVSFTTALDADAYPDVYLTDVEYDLPYTYSVHSIKEESKIAGDEYDLTNDYIVVENVMLNKDETITYKTESSMDTVTFKEYQKMSVSASLGTTGFEQPTGVLNPDVVLETEYIYDPLDESVDVEILTLNVPDEIYNMPGLEDLSVLPGQEVSEFGLHVMDPTGVTVFELPVVSLSLYQDNVDYFSFISAANALLGDYTQTEINLFIDLFSAGAFSFDGHNINVDMDAIQSSGLLDDYIDGIYTIHMDLYDSEQNHTPVTFQVRIGDYIPDVFIDTIIQDGTNYYVSGTVYGAQSLELNGIDATIEHGFFEAVIPISSELINYVLTNNFNVNFSGTRVVDWDINTPTIELSSYDDITIYEGMPYVLPTCVATDVETSGLECDVEYSEFIGEIGSYFVHYSATDDYGNKSSIVTITVNVLDDVTKPVMTLSDYSDITIVEQESYTLPTCTAIDDVMGELNCIIYIEDDKVISGPGEYLVIFTANDLNGNIVTEEITVTVLDDIVKPVVTLSDGSDIVIKEGDELELPTCSATDEIFGTLDCEIEYSPMFHGEPGEYEVFFSATDINGNQSDIHVVLVTVEEQSSNIGLIIGIVSSGTIVVGGGVLFFIIRRFKVV